MKKSDGTRMSVLIGILVGLVILLVVVVVAFALRNRDGGTTTGTATQTSTSVVTVTAPAPAPTTAGPATTSSPTPTPTPTPSSVWPPPGTTLCAGRDDIAVNPSTSCEFAANVATEFFSQGPGIISAHSPVTDIWYEMSCTLGDDNIAVCTGGNNAVVHLRLG